MTTRPDAFLKLAADAATAQEFAKSLGDHGIDASWVDDAELWEFLHAETSPELSIDLAASRTLVTGGRGIPNVAAVVASSQARRRRR